jgi:N-acetylmuramoyl-L-alanine amidase
MLIINNLPLNSFNQDSHGFETFRQPGTGSATAVFQKAVHEEIISFLQPFGIQDRQTKQKNLAVLRETNMPAILVENLFVSNPKEAALLKKAAFLDGLAKAHAEGIAKGAKLIKKVSSSSGTYRIYTGTFKDDASAQKAAKAIGYNAFVKDRRAWTGVFPTKESAEKAQMEIAKNHGFNPQIRKEE